MTKWTDNTDATDDPERRSGPFRALSVADGESSHANEPDTLIMSLTPSGMLFNSFLESL